MDGLVAKIGDASLQLLQRIHPPFLGSTRGLEVNEINDATIIYPTVCNLEPDGYGSDIRKAFCKRQLGGYLLSHPFQANSDLRSKSQLNSTAADFLLCVQSNSSVDKFLFAHPKIGIRLICVTDYQIHMSKNEGIGLMERLAVDMCNLEQYFEIETAMNATNAFDEQWYATADALVEHIETEVNDSLHNLCENEGFKRIVALIIGLRTVYADPFNVSGAFFLTKDQLACIDSAAKIQIIHGEKGVGKTTTLLLKLCETARRIGKQKKISIIAANRTEADRLESAIHNYGVGGNFSVHWMTEESKSGFEFPLDAVESLDCEWLFIDDVSLISHKARVWLESNQKIHLVCVLCDSVPHGLQQSREWFQWIQLNIREAANQNRMQPIENVSVQAANETPSIEKDYFSLSIYTMNRFYPHWMNASYATTTSIPACMDIIYEISEQCDQNVTDDDLVDKRETDGENAEYAHRATVAGQKAETTVHQAFQRLNLGGVLVAGFNTREFWNKVKDNKRGLVDFGIQNKIKRFLAQDQDFESDILFLHPHLGIIVIEVKAVSKVGPESKRYKRAKDQLEKMVNKKIPSLFEILTEEKLCVPINGALGFPNANLSSMPQTPSCWLRIDKTLLEDEETFRAHWVQKIEQNAQKDLNYFTNPAFQRFICAIVAYRSTAVVSHAINALEIYDILDSQIFLKKNPIKLPADESIRSPLKSTSSFSIKLTETQERTFFLTNEQLAIYENELKVGTIEIICGPPGTGKTLLIVLKALKAAEEKRPGRVLVKTRPSLVPKLQLMVKANYKPGNREIVVFDAVVDNQDDCDADDYFADEFDMTLDRKRIYERRSRCAGRNVVAITCAIITSDIPKIKETFESQCDIVCNVHELRQVIRGTKHIVDFWKCDLSQYEISMGHSAIGHPVERFCLKNSSLILEIVLQKIKSFLAGVNKKPLEMKFGPKDLAIIVSDMYFAEYIKNFLATENVLSGSAEDQLKDNNLIAVVVSHDALSYEWPVVLAVDLLLPGLDNSFLVIAASRAIAHLIFIEHDLTYAQNVINDSIDQHFNGDMADVALMDIYKVVDAASKDICEENEPMIIWYNLLLFLARIAFLPQTLRFIEPFKNCSNLFDLLNVLADKDNEYLLHSIAMDRAIGERQLITTLSRQGRGRAILKYVRRPSKLFDNFFPDDSHQMILSHFLERFGSMKENLTSEQDRLGSLRYVFHSTSEEDVLLQLGKTMEWSEILTVIEIISNSCSYLFYFPAII